MSEDGVFVVLESKDFWEKYMPAKIVDGTIEPLAETAFRNQVDAYRTILEVVDVHLACLSPRPVQNFEWERISPTASSAFRYDEAEELGSGMLGWGTHWVEVQPEGLAGRLPKALRKQEGVMEYFVLMQGEDGNRSELYRGTSVEDSWKAVFNYANLSVPDSREFSPVITKDWSRDMWSEINFIED